MAAKNRSTITIIKVVIIIIIIIIAAVVASSQHKGRIAPSSLCSHCVMVVQSSTIIDAQQLHDGFPVAARCHHCFEGRVSVQCKSGCKARVLIVLLVDGAAAWYMQRLICTKRNHAATVSGSSSDQDNI